MIPCLILDGDTPMPGYFLGLVQDNDDYTSAVVQHPRNGLYLSLVHPSRVSFPAPEPAPKPEPAPGIPQFAEGAGTTPITAAERKCAELGQIIIAIKSIRQRTGLGLRDAKALIDACVPEHTRGGR